MKRKLFIIGFLSVVFLMAPVMQSCTSKITAEIGREFTLPLGRTAVIKAEDLTFKFVDVTADSRCARGVECIQAGEAKCRMIITYKGAVSDIIFIQGGGEVSSLGSLNNGSSNSFGVKYQLAPYPEAGKQISKSDYSLNITIAKSATK